MPKIKFNKNNSLLLYYHSLPYLCSVLYIMYNTYMYNDLEKI